ncbi:MAG: DUF6519 domain-containing protein [candidate division Zixibacteria bacterium]
MKGDFSNYRYRPRVNYSSVLKQQGRVALDSDWNEQAKIWDDKFRGFIRDFLGEFAIPLPPDGFGKTGFNPFKIDNFSSGPGDVIDFSVRQGVCYLAGHRFRLENDVTYRTQPDYPEPNLISGQGDNILVYLEVWNKTVSYIDDETLREPALGGPDTCLRKNIVGQISAILTSDINTREKAEDFVKKMSDKEPLLFTLKIDQSAHQIPFSFGDIDMGGGLIPGNLHLRVELHRGPKFNGSYEDGFKWSDDNAATVIRILKTIENNSLILEETEAITGESLKEGDWVEISNAVTELHRFGGQMARIESIEQGANDILVTLNTDIHPLLRRFNIGDKPKNRIELYPRLRRWSGYISPLALKTVYDLGRGMKAIFQARSGFQFNPGDFWTFAIREREYNKKYAPNKAAPDGVEVYRHPLAIIKRGKGKKAEIIDCRKFFKPLAGFPL